MNITKITAGVLTASVLMVPIGMGIGVTNAVATPAGTQIGLELPIAPVGSQHVNEPVVNTVKTPVQSTLTIHNGQRYLTHENLITGH